MADEETRYFGAFSDDVLQAFYRSYDDWELQIVKDGLASAGIVTARNDSSTLRNASPGLLYHAVSNLRIIQDPDVLELVRSRPSVSNWPTDVPPPGLFVLIFDEAQHVRQWSRSFMRSCSEVPMAEHHFVPGHEVALRSILSLIAKTANRSPVVSHFPSVEGETFPIGSAFSSTSDPDEIWFGFCQVLRQIPTNVVLRKYGGADCRSIVTGHLHDTGPRMYMNLLCNEPMAD